MNKTKKRAYKRSYARRLPDIIDQWHRLSFYAKLQHIRKDTKMSLTEARDMVRYYDDLIPNPLP